MFQRTRLLLLIPHLGGGGAERVTTQLAQHLSPDRFEIHLCVITGYTPGAASIPPWVQIHCFHRKHVRDAWLQLIFVIRALQADVLLSNMAHLNFLILLLRPFLPRRTRLLVRQNTTASSAARAWTTRIAYRVLYPRADIILCQSEAMAADFAAKFAIPPDKFAVLLNPIDIGAICAANCRIDQPLDWIDPWPDGSWPRLLTVGRLSAEKGIDLLIRAIPTIQLQFPRVHLLVLGTGPEEAALNRLNQELNLEETITFAGYQQNPAAFCAGATLFVLPSRYEGMPNALLEAAAAGLPLVATPCCTGICDLLRNAPGTWISSEITHHALAETVLASLDTLKTWPNPPRRIPHAFLAPFALETAIAAYTELIERAAQARP